MTRIDFHTGVADQIAYTCRLVRKARAAQCRIVVLARDHQQMAQLDEALWIFSDTDFLPHVPLGSPLARQTPILLADSDQAEPLHYQLLVNLSGATPSYFASFERMLEILGLDEENVKSGRERYAFYKQRGYPLNHYVAEAS